MIVGGVPLLLAGKVDPRTLPNLISTNVTTWNAPYAVTVTTTTDPLGGNNAYNIVANTGLSFIGHSVASWPNSPANGMYHYSTFAKLGSTGVGSGINFTPLYNNGNASFASYFINPTTSWALYEVTFTFNNQTGSYYPAFIGGNTFTTNESIALYAPMLVKLS